MDVDNEVLVTLPLAIQLAKERLWTFQCTWILKRSDRTPYGPCKINLNSWHSLRQARCHMMQHMLTAHCREDETECKLSGCNLVNKITTDAAELRKHILTGHLNNLKLPCPIRDCTDVLRETRLGHHFRSEHGNFLDQPLSQLQGELHSIHPYKREAVALEPLPSESVPAFAAYALPLHPHNQHVQLPEEDESSEPEADEEILQLTLGMKEYHIEFQEKLVVAETEFFSMPFDPHGRIPSTKWPPEKSIGYEAFAKKMAELHPKPKEPAEQPQQQQQPQPQTQHVAGSPASASSRPFSTGQYARKTGVPARGRVRVSDTA